MSACLLLTLLPLSCVEHLHAQVLDEQSRCPPPAPAASVRPPPTPSPHLKARGGSVVPPAFVLESRAGVGGDASDDDEGAGAGGADDLEFGFYRGRGGGYDSEDDEEADKDEGDGIAGILKNPNALTDSRYTAGFQQLSRALIRLFTLRYFLWFASRLRAAGEAGTGRFWYCLQGADVLLRVTCHASLINHQISTHRTSHVTHLPSHITHHTSPVTRHTSHISRHTSHITHHTSHITHHTSPVTHRRSGAKQARRRHLRGEACFAVVQRCGVERESAERGECDV
jgi:hypothetical protein